MGQLSDCFQFLHLQAAKCIREFLGTRKGCGSFLSAEMPCLQLVSSNVDDEMLKVEKRST